MLIPLGCLSSCFCICFAFLWIDRLLTQSLERGWNLSFPLAAQRNKKLAILCYMLVFPVAVGVLSLIHSSSSSVTPVHELERPRYQPSIRQVSFPARCTPPPDASACYTLLYAPKTAQTASFMSSFARFIGLDPNSPADLLGFPSEAELDAFVLRNPGRVQGAYLLGNGTRVRQPLTEFTLPPTVQYVVEYDRLQQCRPDRTPPCNNPALDVALPMVYAMDSFILGQTQPSYALRYDIATYPSGPLRSNVAAFAFSHIVLTVAFLIWFHRQLMLFVREKSRGTRDALRTANVPDSPYWLATAVFLLMQALPSIFLGYLIGVATGNVVFLHPNMETAVSFFLLVWLWFLVLSGVASCLLESAGGCLLVTFMLSFFCFFTEIAVATNVFVFSSATSPAGSSSSRSNVLPSQVVNVCGLMVPCLFAKTLREFILLPDGGSNGSGSAPASDAWPTSSCISTILGHVVIGCIVWWYADNVQAMPLGVRGTWLFFADKYYWTRRDDSKAAADPETFFLSEAFSIAEDDDCRIERELIMAVIDEPWGTSGEEEAAMPPPLLSSVRFKEGILFQNVVLNYRNDRRQKVDIQRIVPELRYLYLHIHKNEFFAMLGPRLGGKSSVAALMAGLLQPSGGQILVGGRSVFAAEEAIRLDFGYSLFCASEQRHLLPFEDLTVDGNMNAYCRLRRLKLSVERDRMGILYLLLEMTHLMDVVVSRLSYLDRAKLSIALAFLGTPQFVVLDDPTKGLSPHDREFIWGALRKLAVDRTVLLLTSNPEEAFSLAERMAILINGQIVSLGSPAHILDKFDQGYKLDISFAHKGAFHKTNIIAAVKQALPEASVLSETVPVTAVGTSSLTMQLPKASTTQIGSLMVVLESRRQDLGILSIDLRKCLFEDEYRKMCLLSDEEFQQERRDHRKMLVELRERRRLQLRRRRQRQGRKGRNAEYETI